MYCKSCGKNIDNDSIFCSFCGTKQFVESEKLVNSNHVNEISISNDKTIYDVTYKKDSDAQFTGIMLLIITFICIIFSNSLDKVESRQTFSAIINIISLIVRIAITSWVLNIAKQQNREATPWGFFAFFLPSVALIVIGNKKKLYANVELISNLTNQQNSTHLTEKAREFFKNENYSDSIRFAERAIELDYKNNEAKRILNEAEKKLLLITELTKKGNVDDPSWASFAKVIGIVILLMLSIPIIISLLDWLNFFD